MASIETVTVKVTIKWGAFVRLLFAKAIRRRNRITIEELIERDRSGL